MKIIILALVLLVSCGSMAQDSACSKFKKAGWRIAYNHYQKKFAVIRDAEFYFEKEFLLKDHYGKYGIYGEGWEDKECMECGDKSKSLFTNPCDAKKFLIEYYKKEKFDKWQ
jgi:opacity protein-like surface antigen